MNKYEDVLAQCTNYEQTIIYGGHLIARETSSHLIREGVSNFIGFGVTQMDDNPEIIDGYPVKEINEYIKYKESGFVIIATPDQYVHDIQDNLERLGFRNYTSLSLRAITLILSRDIVRTSGLRMDLYAISKSKYDYNWLDVSVSKILGKVDRNEYYKFPIMSHYPISMRLDDLLNIEISSEYLKLFGAYRNVTKLTKDEDTTLLRNWNVYMVMSHKDKKNMKDVIIPEHLKPIQAGCALTIEKLDAIHDDNGENISSKNGCLSEMTACYWVWKNSTSKDYTGICHYRRHFAISNSSYSNIANDDIDVILPIPRFVSNGVGSMFAIDTPVSEVVLENMLSSIETQYGAAIRDEAVDYLGSHLYFPNNMLIAKRDVFDSYCAWIFPVLLDMYQKDIIENVNMDDRHIAYASEILTSLYFHINMRHLKISVAEYNYLED